MKHAWRKTEYRHCMLNGGIVTLQDRYAYEARYTEL